MNPPELLPLVQIPRERLHREIMAGPCQDRDRIGPASPSRTTAARARPTACTPSSLWTETAGRSGWTADIATASTTFAADRRSSDREHPRMPALSRAAAGQ